MKLMNLEKQTRAQEKVSVFLGSLCCSLLFHENWFGLWLITAQE